MEQALQLAKKTSKNVLLNGRGFRYFHYSSTSVQQQQPQFSSKFTLQKHFSVRNNSSGPQNGVQPEPPIIPENNNSSQNTTATIPQKISHATDLSDLEQLVGADQANSIRADLAENEQTGSINEKSKRNRKYKGVVQFWSNYIASNTPIEDRRVGLRNSIRKRSSRSNHVRTIYSEEESYFFGVLDGHGGGQCADVVSKRIGDYYMTTQVPNDEIKNYLVIANQQVSGKTFAPRLLPYRSRNLFNDRVAGDHTYPISVNVFNDIWPMWRDSLHKFAYDIAQGDVRITNDQDAVREAIMRLDNDIMDEAYR